MKRRSNSALRTLFRTTALLLTPSLIAASASGIDWLSNGRKSPELSEERSPAASAYAGSSGQVINSGSELSGSLILSEGYGISDEAADEPFGVRLVSPLAMTNPSPGDKPYPTSWGTGGSVVRTTYAPYSGDTFFDLKKGGQVNNKTAVPNNELIAVSGSLPCFTVTDTAEPQVLIYHTHTCESFEPCVRDEYDPAFNYRTTDDTKNVVMVGDAIQAELEAQDIGVIHVRTVHDYPSYNGAYDRSRETIVPILEKYPSIKVVLDIHRDAISGDGVIYQPFVSVNGREAAQVMIISGCDDGTLGMPSYMKNFRFACALQQQLEGDTPGLTRPVLFDYRKYNQDLTTGSLLIEVGSHGNTLEQVQYSGQLIGRSLGRLLNSMKNERKG
ncbi:MAG: stage II sporulation protein P [Ruminococcus sp.]|nr:stage II sporulation protein P [Ruminococcus sp.]